LLKIVQIDTGSMREDSPDLQEKLEPGYLWMPVVVSGLPGTQFNEEREYFFDEFKYILVEPLEIGFNKVAMNGVVVYQRKQIRVAMNTKKKTVWEAVETDQFDPSQKCFFGAPDGDPQVNPTSTLRPSRTPSSDSAVGLPVTPP
jgi:hypothetical protein